jgi:hypothetical protein
MRRLPHQGARHSTVDHGDASNGVFLLLQGCLGRASTSSATCGCFLRVERSSLRMISLLFSLSSLWMASRANGSPCEWRRLHVLRVASSSGSGNGGRTDVGMGQVDRPGLTVGPGPFQSDSVAPSHMWVLLTFCTFPPPISSLRRCHPRVQDGGSSRMKFGLLRFNPQGCSFVTLRSLPPLGVISSCSRT